LFIVEIFLLSYKSHRTIPLKVGAYTTIL
jgi:hypothetical protein